MDAVTTRQRLVLEELRWLCDEAPRFAADAQEGWLPFHVIFFRPESALRGEEVGAVMRELRKLRTLGLVARTSERTTHYTIVAAGRALLDELGEHPLAPGSDAT